MRKWLPTISRFIAAAGFIIVNALAPAAPTLAVTPPVVTLSTTTVSNNSSYTIAFNLTKQLTAGDNITIAFPADTGIQTGNITYNVSVTASQASNSTENISGLDAAGDNATRTVIIRLNGAGNVLGEGSQVTVVLGSQIIRNPSQPGNYGLNVSTSNETNPVTSSSYAITLPRFGGPIPPLVTGKNAAGEVIFSRGIRDLNEAINTPNVTRIEVDFGFFNTTVNASVRGQTIVVTGKPGDVKLNPGTPGV